MDCLCDAENAWLGFRYIPTMFHVNLWTKYSARHSPRHLHTDHSSKSHQSMSHERNPSTLRSSTEESYLCASCLELRCKFHHGLPSRVSTSRLIALNVAHLGPKSSINPHQASIPDLKQWRFTRTKIPVPWLVYISLASFVRLT